MLTRFWAHLRQPHGSGALAFPQGGWVDPGDDHVVPVRRALQPAAHVQGYLRRVEHVGAGQGECE